MDLWHGKIKSCSVSNEIMHHMDWLPTLLAIAGDKDVKAKLLKGHQAGNMTYKVHPDGYNFLPYLTGREKKGPRDEIFYFTDDGDLSALRFRDWKIIFLEQRVEATLQAWAEPFVQLRVPLIFNLRRDPYERARVTSNTHYDWLLDRAYLLVPAQAYVGNSWKRSRSINLVRSQPAPNTNRLGKRISSCQDHVTKQPHLGDIG